MAKMRGMLLKALPLLFLLAVVAAPSRAQSRSELNGKYGRPETLSHKSSAILVERYNVLTGVRMTVKFVDGERACELRLEPVRTATVNGGPSEVIKSFDAAMLVDELAPDAKRGRLIKTSNVNLSCSSVVYNEYEHVMIAVVTLCPAQGGGVQSIQIRWKERACERLERKESAPAGARPA
jgi:hypothetical protein